MSDVNRFSLYKIYAHTFLWFYAMQRSIEKIMNVWCPCREPYHPNSSSSNEQRFCLTCARWYHVAGCSYSLDRCVVKVQTPVSDPVEVMATAPIFRGFSYEWGCKWSDWCFVGNGRERVYAETLIQQYRTARNLGPVKVPAEALTKLGSADLISTCKLVRQQLYLCQNCHLPI
jgi:hypothetical protein